MTRGAWVLGLVVVACGGAAAPHAPSGSLGDADGAGAGAETSAPGLCSDEDSTAVGHSDHGSSPDGAAVHVGQCSAKPAPGATKSAKPAPGVAKSSSEAEDAKPPEKDPPHTAIVQAGHAVLRERAKEVPIEQIRTPEFQALLERMKESMRAAPGVGIAAPQIGVPLRVFLVEDREEYIARMAEVEVTERERTPVPLRVFINPKVTPIGKEKVTFFEGCLSVNGWSALVTRAREVSVEALDERGEKVSWRVRGWPARILQHEMDHLEGTLYIDRMHTRSFATHAAVKERFAGKPARQVLHAHGL